MNLNKKTNKGFTIIEVLIVLAIAAAIMLVVFLAVPALNRNSKNNSRKSDVSRILASVQEYTTNTNGSLPATGNLTTAFASTLPSLSSYATNDVAWTNNSAAPATAISAPTDGTRLSVVRVSNYMKCDTNGTNAVVGGGARDVAAVFNIETASSVQQQCVAM